MVDMSTPMMRSAAWGMYCVAFLLFVYFFMILVTHAYNFHENYTAHTNKVAEEKWLLERCKDPEFYANMRQHSDLCETVSLNARRSAVLSALNAIAANTFLCGSQTCLSLIQGIINDLGWRLLAFLSICTLAVPHVYWILANFWRAHHRMGVKDRFIAPRYNYLDEDWDHKLMRRRPIARIDDGEA